MMDLVKVLQTVHYKSGPSLREKENGENLLSLVSKLHYSGRHLRLAIWFLLSVEVQPILDA